MILNYDTSCIFFFYFRRRCNVVSRSTKENTFVYIFYVMFLKVSCVDIWETCGSLHITRQDLQKMVNQVIQTRMVTMCNGNSFIFRIATSFYDKLCCLASVLGVCVVYKCVNSKKNPVRFFSFSFLWQHIVATQCFGSKSSSCRSATTAAPFIKIAMKLTSSSTWNKRTKTTRY